LIFAFLFSGKDHHQLRPSPHLFPSRQPRRRGIPSPRKSPSLLRLGAAGTVSQSGRQFHPASIIDTETPPPIPQAIYATKETSRSESYLPFGRLLRCELVNTVDSTDIETPIIGLITEDVWHDGRLIIPAGTEVHGIAQKTAARERIGSERKWVRISGRPGIAALRHGSDYAPDAAKPGGWKRN